MNVVEGSLNGEGLSIGIVVSKFNEPPLTIKILFKILGFSFANENKINKHDDSEEKKLSNSTGFLCSINL